MKIRYSILIAMVVVLAGSLIFFSIFSIFYIETNNSRGRDFCENNDMNFDTRKQGFTSISFYCTRILDNAFIEKEIKLSGKNWGFA